MTKKYLVVNLGSTSKKYAFYVDHKKVYSSHFEMENNNVVVTETIDGVSQKKSVSKKEYPKSVGLVISSLIDNKLIASKKEVDGIAVRIVAPGEYFLTNKIITKEYLKKTDLALEQVPLHLGPALKEIENIKEFLGNGMPIYGISDSAFHATIPEYAKFYAIPIKDSRKLGLYQFGYHGISVQSVVSRAKNILGTLPRKVIVCHLGGGASVTAVKNGKSIDTSMGFTPLEGLIMATRVGDIDPGAVLYLSKKLKKTNSELESYFNNESGLLGLSGKSSDLRELLEHEKNGHADSSLALKIYTNKIKQYIGRMAAVLGGVDLLILAGTVGERSSVLRERICGDLNFLGIDIDKKLNSKLVGVEARIEKAGSKVKILVVKTDEMEEMAKITYDLLS